MPQVITPNNHVGGSRNWWKYVHINHRRHLPRYVYLFPAVRLLVFGQTPLSGDRRGYMPPLLKRLLETVVYLGL